MSVLKIFSSGKSIPISSILDPTLQIRSTCDLVYQSARHVQVDEENVARAALEFKSTNFEVLRNGVKWDACGWHYNLDAESCGPLTCQYVFVMDALNFCFWPCPNLEYDTLAISLKSALENDPHIFSARRLATLSHVGNDILRNV